MRHWLLLSILLLLLAACEPAPQDEGQLPTLAVLPSPTPEIPRPLNFWQSVGDSLYAAGQIHRWQFAGQRDDPVRVRAIGNGIPVSLTLSAPDGKILGTGETIELTLQESGTYTVAVQLAQEGVGSYELGLSYTDRPNPNDLLPTQVPEVVGVPTPTPPYADLGTFINSLISGQTIGAVVEESSFRHVYTFTGAAGQYVNVMSSRVSGDVDPVLTLFGPEGLPLALDDNSGGGTAAQLTNVRLPEDGLYSIQVGAKNFTGSYQVSLLVNPQPQPVTPSSPLTPTPTSYNIVLKTLTPTVPTHSPGNQLEDHVPVVGEIEPRGDFERFPVFAPAGATITIGAKKGQGSIVRPKIEVYGPAGDLLAFATAQDAQRYDWAVVNMQITVTGTYVVFITGDNNSTGRFVVAYGRGDSFENVLRGQAFADQPIREFMAIPGQREVWNIQLNKYDIITAAVSPVNSFLDPVLELVTPEGTVLAVDDNGGGGTSALISSVRAPETGTYLLQVTAANAASSGDYQLIWRYVNVAPTNTPPPNTYRVLTVNDIAPENEYMFYPFQGQTGDRMQIQVVAAEGTGLDPVAVLIAPDGTEIAQGDDSPNDLNPRFTVDLPMDGTYNVRVNGYLSWGAFRLTVDKDLN